VISSNRGEIGDGVNRSCVLGASTAVDALGRRVFERAGGDSRRFEYDDLDRVVVRVDAVGGSERFHYDEDGLPVQHVQPGSSWSGGDGEVVVGYEYDERGGLSRLRDPHAGDWQLERDAIGRVISRRDPAGGEWRALYTEEGFIDRIEISVPGTGGDYIDYSGYDALGNPEVITTVEGTTEVVYDSLSRVTEVVYPGSGGSEIFAYDRVGNRIGHIDRSGVARVHVVDAADELLEIKAGGSIVESFGYDGAGRRVSRVESGGGVTHYGYDGLGALTSVSRTGYSASLAYDAAGQVSARSETGGTAYYPSPALESRGGHSHRILRAPGSGSVIGEVERTASGHRVHQPHRDGSGSVARVGIQEEDLDVLLESPPARYEAFGALRSGGSVLERGFAGQVREGETGLLRMGMRHYDPATGRFLQGDALGIAASELYAYASNNPYRFWDPTGLSPVETGLTGEESEEGDGEWWQGWLDFGIGASIGIDANIGFDYVTGSRTENFSAAGTCDAGQMFFVDARRASDPGDVLFDASAFFNLGGFARAGQSLITSPTFNPDRNFVRGPIPLPGRAQSLGGFVGGGFNILFSTTSDPTAFSRNLSRQAGFDFGLGPLGGISLKVAGNTRGDLIFIFSGGPLSRGVGISLSEVPSTTFTPLR
jgi:RHS repeat-associated protein